MRIPNFFTQLSKIRFVGSTLKLLKNRMVNGATTLRTQEIASEAVHFFENLYKFVPTESYTEILEAIPVSLDALDNEALMVLPDELEVRNAIWSLIPDAAPGPDGFAGLFTKDVEILLNVMWYLRL
ncbi:unnamed protein product [Cuscuta europaea]|uniref:Uncharacterized protein n=1 Tax=Cuscuta europaea TaxID=41803 RepID=A0A9P1E3A3_CUSEU|nr:unnamed protein product [Cuscuta europaea]